MAKSTKKGGRLPPQKGMLLPMVDLGTHGHADVRRDDHSAIRVGSGPCQVCGEATEYYLAKTGDGLRENYCSKCGATRAARDLARVVLETVGLDPNSSLAGQRKAFAGICMLAMPAAGRIGSVFAGRSGRETADQPIGEPPEKKTICIETSQPFPLAYPDDHFDLVITEDILQSIEDPLSALLEIARVLKPKGYHLFAVPASEDVNAIAFPIADRGIIRRPASQDLSGERLAQADAVVYADIGTGLSTAVADSGLDVEVAAFTRFYPADTIRQKTKPALGRQPDFDRNADEVPVWQHCKNSIVFRSSKNGKRIRCTGADHSPLAVDAPTPKEVILHIGTPKTATSYLQSFFAKNTQALSANGFHYPAMISLGEAAAGAATSGNAFILARSLLDEKDTRKIRGSAAEAAWNKFERVLDESPLPKIVLSSEYFYVAPKEAYVKIKEACDQRGFRCRMIVYLRRQDHFLQSQYAQYIKKGAGNLTAEEFCAEHSNLGVFQYLKRLNLIADVIGIENCMVRPYENDQFKGGSIGADILDGLGVVNVSEFIFPDSLINKSPSPLELDIIRYINANNPKPSGHVSLALISALQQIYVGESVSDGRLISPVLQHKIVDRFESENCEIARRFMGRADGRLFNEPLPDLSLSWEAPMPMPDSPGVRILARMAVVLCNEILELKKNALRHTVSS